MARTVRRIWSCSANEAVISTETDFVGQGGDVVIAAGDVHLLDASTILTKTFGPGGGGDVHITADSLTLENRSGITTETSTFLVLAWWEGISSCMWGN